MEIARLFLKIETKVNEENEWSEKENYLTPARRSRNLSEDNDRRCLTTEGTEENHTVFLCALCALCGENFSSLCFCFRFGSGSAGLGLDSTFVMAVASCSNEDTRPAGPDGC